MADLPSMIVDKLVENITSRCQIPYPIGDDTRVNLIVKGEFQDDPEDYGTIICVHRNDPDRVERIGTASWQDEIDVSEMTQVIGVGGLGHVEHWFRRFTVEVIVWPNTIQEEADEINGTIMSRVRRAVSMEPMHGLADPFGESITVSGSPIRKIKTNEGGGPDDEYSWRSFLYLEYKTVWVPSQGQ